MPAPYHVVYLLHSLGRGGTENGVVNLLNGLDSERFRFTIVLAVNHGTGEREMLSRVERGGVEVMTVPRRVGNDPMFPLRLAKLFRSTKPDRPTWCTHERSRASRGCLVRVSAG